MATYGKDLLDKISSNKSKNSSDIIREQTEGSLKGNAIGLFLGLYIGYSRNYSLVLSAAIGAIIGGLVTKTLISKK